MQKQQSRGRRYGQRVGEVSEYAARIREVHDTARELIQLFFYLILSGLSLGMVLVGAWRIRLYWLG